MPGLSIGLGAKFVRESIDDGRAAAVAGDAGAMYQTAFEDHTVRWGAALKDVGAGSGAADGGKAVLPSALRLGVSDRLLNENLILSAEAAFPRDTDWSGGLGSEIFLAGFFSLRAGYRFRQDDVTGIEGFTAGFGAVFAAGQDYVVDYAYAGQGELGLSHRLSLSLRF